MTDTYGTAALTQLADGTVIVEHADPIILVTRELWDQAQPPHRDRAEDGILQLDTAGRYRYRLIGTDPDGLIFERIEEPT